MRKARVLYAGEHGLRSGLPRLCLAAGCLRQVFSRWSDPRPSISR
jgi:hypothetical protein